MTTRLLFVGDIHLGRRPTGLGEALGALGLDPRALSPAATWAETVEEAIRSRAAAVVLAGDVVEGERDRFEAAAHLERGVAALLEAGIATFGVAGNHDVFVLPRLAKRIRAFGLLGAGGRWELRQVPGAPVDLLGWSFPEARVFRSPLDASLAPALAGRRPDAAVLGVLHADLDAVGSPYAPVSRAELARVATDAWFLGHVHAPADLAVDRPLGYLGSLVGLDPGEPGPRGPWQVDVDGTGRLTTRRVPLVPIRWEAVTVDLSGLDARGEEAVDGVQRHVAEALEARSAADATLGDPRLRLVAARVTMTGQPADRGAARRYAELRPEARLGVVGRVPFVVESARDQTQARVDLASLAAQPTPVGLLAKRLLALERGDDDAWLASIEGRATTYRTGGWAETERPLPPTREVALAAGRRLLDALLAQQGA